MSGPHRGKLIRAIIFRLAALFTEGPLGGYGGGMPRQRLESCLSGRFRTITTVLQFGVVGQFNCGGLMGWKIDDSQGMGALTKAS
jgi:hypothetical protein